jgi:hypothetical protein
VTKNKKQSKDIGREGHNVRETRLVGSSRVFQETKKLEQDNFWMSQKIL